MRKVAQMKIMKRILILTEKKNTIKKTIASKKDTQFAS